MRRRCSGSLEPTEFFTEEAHFNLISTDFIMVAEPNIVLTSGVLGALGMLGFNVLAETLLTSSTVFQFLLAFIILLVALGHSLALNRDEIVDHLLGVGF
jgi:hypothetical protein